MLHLCHALWLNGSDTREPLKMVGVECENVSEVMHHHRSDKPCIMRCFSDYLVPNYKILPL